MAVTIKYARLRDTDAQQIVMVILGCWRIVPFDENYFNQGSSDVYFVKNTTFLFR